MANAKLHLDADVSYKSLAKALRERGHDVSRTPSDWIALDADDATQLREASAQGRCILTFNIGDFVPLSREIPEHGGIILAHQRGWTLSSLVAALDRLLNDTTAEDWPGQARWLNDWRE
ncbi:MAG: DUF5615 family PIN-like protein [Chloroflexota bacterium]